MRPRRPAVWVDRPIHMARLSSDHAVAIVVGPWRGGKTTLLAGWSQTTADVVWMDEDMIPDVDRGVIVVDDADRLSARTWTELGRRMDTCPGLRLRLSSTTADVLPPSWDAEVVGDLHFTFDEIASYLERAGSPLEPRLVAAATRGHAGSVRELARPGIRDAGRIPAVLAQASVGRRLPPSERWLAVPDHLTEELVRRWGGPDTFLDDAVRAGLGAWSTDASSRVFSLVPTVRAATQAHSVVSPSREGALRREAAAVFLAQDAPFAAFVEAVRGDDLDLAVTALKAGGMSLLVEHGVVVGDLLRPLSLNRLRRQPVLALALALILNARRQNRLRAIELFGVAVLGARLGAGRPVDRALMQVVESAALRVVGAADGGLASARRATRALRSADPDDLVSLGRVTPHLHVHAGVSLLYGECRDEAREQFELALAAGPELGAELSAIGGLALVDALEGETDAADQWLALAASRVWPKERLDEYPGSMLRLAQSLVAVDANDFDGAAEALDTIWPIVDTIEHWALMAHVRALVDIGTGRGAEGLERFRSLRRSREGRFGTIPSVRRLLSVTESLLLLASGLPVEAREAIGDPQQHPGSLLAALRVALVLRDTDQALALLVHIVPRGPRDRVTLQASEAVLLRLLGRSDDAEDVAAKAAALVATHRLRSPLMLLPPGHLDLFGVAGEGVVEGLAHDSVAPPVLTPRELVVLRELASTSSVEDIAAALHVSSNTVKSQRRSLYRKLGVHSREEALVEGLRHGLLTD